MTFIKYLNQLYSLVEEIKDAESLDSTSSYTYPYYILAWSQSNNNLEPHIDWNDFLATGKKEVYLLLLSKDYPQNLFKCKFQVSADDEVFRNAILAFSIDWIRFIDLSQKKFDQFSQVAIPCVEIAIKTGTILHFTTEEREMREREADAIWIDMIYGRY